MSEPTTPTTTMENFQISPMMAEYLTFQQAVGIYNACWLGVLVTIVVTLILLSTPNQRRGTVFWIQCLAYVMAVVNALLITMAVVNNLRQNFIPGNIDRLLTNVECAQKAFEVFTPLVSDMTLIFKVKAFYPPTIQPNRARRLMPILPLLVLAVCRLAVCSVLCYYYWQYDMGAGLVAADITRRFGAMYHRVVWAEFSTQIAFCSYASAVLFRKIYLFAQRRRSSRSRTPVLQRKLRFLIESLAMTFVLPIIAQVVALSASATGHGNVLFVASMTNVYLSTLLSVLATSWSTIRLTRIQQARYSTLTSGGTLRPPSGGSDEMKVDHGRFDSPPEAGHVCGKGNGVQTQQYLAYGGQQPVSRFAVAKGDGNGGGAGQGLGQGQGEMDDLGDAHRGTLIASLFNSEEEPSEHVGSIEMLTSFQQTHSGIQRTATLPARGTSGWRRGLLRSGG